MKSEIPEDLLDQFRRYVSRRLGLSFPRERRSDLERGLERAAGEFGFDNAEACTRWLMLSPLTRAQVEILASHLTVGETYFFRDRTMFDVLESQVLPELIRKRRATGRNLRIWSAGCATGEEPYSVAILLRRMVPDYDDWNITILGTDINPSFLRKASQGVYGEWSFRDVPRWVKDRCFQRTGKGSYKVLPGIHNSVSFFYHNLAEDLYPSLTNNTNAMDIIFCRNVLMYFLKDLQKEVVRRLCHCLVEEGLLIVSPIEFSAALCPDLAQVRIPGAAFYRKERTDRTKTACPPMIQSFPIESAKRSAPPERPAYFDVQEPSFSAPVTAPVYLPVQEPSFPETVTAPPRAPKSKETAARPSGEYQEALLLYGKGRYDEAEEKIRTIMAAGENTVPALALLSRLGANRGGFAEARELCEKAIALDKLKPGCHYLHATILQELGLLQEAAASLKRALYLDQNFVLAHFALGIFARRQGKERESEKHFGNARSALRNYSQDDILPESEGITAGRMEEIITAALRDK